MQLQLPWLRILIYNKYLFQSIEQWTWSRAEDLSRQLWPGLSQPGKSAGAGERSHWTFWVLQVLSALGNLCLRLGCWGQELQHLFTRCSLVGDRCAALLLGLLGFPNSAAQTPHHSSQLRALFTEAGLSSAEHLGLDVFAPRFWSSKFCWVDRQVPPSFVWAWCSPEGSFALGGFWRFLCQCLKVAALLPPYSLMPSPFSPVWEMPQLQMSSFSSSCQGYRVGRGHTSTLKSQGAAPTKKGPLGSWVTFFLRKETSLSPLA